MKKMKFQTKAALTAAVLAGTTGAASAQIIGAQFVANGIYTGTGVLGESFVADSLGQTTVGAGGSTGNINFGTSGNSEVLGISGVTLNVNSASTDQYLTERGTDQATDIYANTLEVRKLESTTFTLSGLVSGNLYDVVLYGGNFSTSSNNDPFAVTVNGATTSGISGTANDAPTPTAGVNYFEDMNVAANSSGNIVIVASATGGSKYNPINGVSVEALSAAAPEPSVWASMLLGTGVLVGFQTLRRRSA